MLAHIKNITRFASTNNISPEKLITPSIPEFPAYLKNIESKWKTKVERRFDRERYVGGKQEKTNDKLPRYILSMFPYPSGRLHLGHVRIYTSSDLLTRYSRLLSNNKDHPFDFSHVINPMGFDSFGLPAENAARERGLNPASWTNSNIRVMKKQLDDLAIQFDWREATSNPSFYKWTQDIFLKLMDAGLVYKSYAQVNWDPIDETVLADEQVDADGYSWRSGAKVERRNYRQWFIKVNAFAHDIYLAEHVDPTSWRDILAIQRSWIGKPSGWLFYIPVSNPKSGTPDILPVFTRNPALFINSDTKLLISNDHWLEKVHDISKVGFILNPFTGHKMKVSLIEDIDELPKGTKATLSSINSNLPPELGEEQKINGEQVLLLAKLKNLGGYYTSDKYRDWLISRQRFWGTPIPVINCENCGPKGVPRKMLPVKLPEVENFDVIRNLKSESLNKDGIVSPIEKLAPDDWLKVECPTCGTKSKRECETFDTLFDSSWYFLRYATSPPVDVAFDSKRVQPVWCYIGGKEHASMHLFYARFMTHFLHSRGDIKFKEPFGSLLVQGVVKSRTHKLNGRYISQDQLEALCDKSQVTVDYEKMSKSKGNGVDPQHLIDKYGCDATRLCLMSYTNPRSERLWRSDEEEFRDVILFLRRMTFTVQEYIDVGNSLRSTEKNPIAMVRELDRVELDSQRHLMNKARNRCAVDSSFHIERTNQFRQYISALHSLLNAVRSSSKTSMIYTKEYAEALAALIIMLNPLTPHFTEELWSHFSRSKINPIKMDPTIPYDISLPVGDQPWPVPDRNELEARTEVGQTEREKKKRRYREKKVDTK